MDDIAGDLARRWGFSPTEELPGGHCSRVYADGRRVLKVPFQGEEQTTGYRAAMRMQGALGPRVWAGDPETGSLLMDRCVPGETLASAGLDDAIAQGITIGLSREITKLSPEGAMPVASHYEESGHPLLRLLQRTTGTKVFLHGDLHHFNVLRHGERWVPIDPKGLVGDPAFEAVAYLRNPIDDLPAGDALISQVRARLGRFEQELGFDPWRVLAWSVLDRETDDPAEPSSPWGRLAEVVGQMEAEYRPRRRRRSGR